MTTRKRHVVRVAGVEVTVFLDGDGRPLSATAGIARPGDPEYERLVALAVDKVLAAAQSDRKRAERKASSTTAAAESARQRAQASAEHWSNEWFAKAHAAHPSYGKDRLAQHARRLAAAGGIEPDTKRDEISVERARQFLERLHKAST